MSDSKKKDLQFVGHHGDVGLWLASALPKGLKKVKGLVLHKGEGIHSHVFTADSDVEIGEDNEGNRWFAVGPRGATITHEEHKTEVFQPGTVFKTIIERTRDPFKQMIQKVQD